MLLSFLISFVVVSASVLPKSDVGKKPIPLPASTRPRMPHDITAIQPTSSDCDDSRLHPKNRSAKDKKEVNHRKNAVKYVNAKKNHHSPNDKDQAKIHRVEDAKQDDKCLGDNDHKNNDTIDDANAFAMYSNSSGNAIEISALSAVAGVIGVLLF